MVVLGRTLQRPCSDALVTHEKIRTLPLPAASKQGPKGESMNENLEKVKLLAFDLRDGKEFPRSPRETLAGYVLAARAVDKCRAVIAGSQGEYHSNCPLDQRWLKFAEIDYNAYK